MLLAELARVQHGVVAIWQLYLLGFTARAVERRLESGRLHRVRRGVYAVGHAKLSERGHWMAAVLACGRAALLSHRSAAGLRSFMPDGRATIDVTVPGRSRAGIAGIRLHQPRSLHPDDVDVYDGIPTTSVARLLLDVAETEPRRTVERVLEAAERERALDRRKLDELLDRSRGRKGAKPLSCLLAAVGDHSPHARSELERRFLKMCRDAGVRSPAVNAWVGEHEVDMLWADERIIVELDGWETHRTRQAFERDRTRDVQLQLMGYTVLRFTWKQLESEPEVLLAAVEQLLARGALSVL